MVMSHIKFNISPTSLFCKLFNPDPLIFSTLVHACNGWRPSVVAGSFPSRHVASLTSDENLHFKFKLAFIHNIATKQPFII